MYRPTAADLLDVWDRGVHEAAPGRAVVLLTAMDPAASRDELAMLSLGERDRRLLELRLAIFGDACEVFTACPRCAAELEFALSARELLVRMESGLPAATGPDAVEAEGLTLRFRLPTTADLAVAAKCIDAEHARRTIFARCVVAADRDGVAVDCEQLPVSLLGSFDTWLEAQGGGEELLLALECIACGQPWEMLFDVASFLWREIEVRTRLLLVEVGTLAREFGWSEAAILALSAPRRAAYMEMVL